MPITLGGLPARDGPGLGARLVGLTVPATASDSARQLPPPRPDQRSVLSVGHPAGPHPPPL